jgi:hypothetical protein
VKTFPADGVTGERETVELAVAAAHEHGVADEYRIGGDGLAGFEIPELRTIGPRIAWGKRREIPRRGKSFSVPQWGKWVHSISFT